MGNDASTEVSTSDAVIAEADAGAEDALGEGVQDASSLPCGITGFPFDAGHCDPDGGQPHMVGCFNVPEPPDGCSWLGDVPADLFVYCCP